MKYNQEMTFFASLKERSISPLGKRREVRMGISP
jgi:hypothetical protein